MKRILIILFAVAALAACSEEPTVSIDKEAVEIAYTGGSVDLNVDANYPWELLCDDDSLLTISQLNGEGPATIQVKVAPNTSEKDNNFYLTVVAHGTERDALKTFVISQPASAYIKFNKSIYIVEYTGEEASFSVSGNNPWTITCDASDVEVKPLTGDPAAEDVKDNGVITVKIGEYLEPAAREINLYVVSNTDDGIVRDTLTITQKAPSVTIGTREYPIRRMPDGRWWITENLCYAAKGIVIGDGKCGIWYPSKSDAAEADSETESIQAKGLLYSDQVAFDTQITKTTCKKQEGKQGICPEGWHIPTKAELDALVAAAPDLKAAGFNPTQAGYVQGSGAGYENGFSYKGYTSGKGLTSTYYFCSTYSTTTQWYGLQIDANGKGTVVNTLYNYASARPFAASLRCIRNEE